MVVVLGGTVLLALFAACVRGVVGRLASSPPAEYNSALRLGALRDVEGKGVLQASWCSKLAALLGEAYLPEG